MIFIDEDNGLWKELPDFMKGIHNFLVLLAVAWLALVFWCLKIAYEGGVWAYNTFEH